MAWTFFSLLKVMMDERNIIPTLMNVMDENIGLQN